MKAEYLRHEYTWSNHGITGNALGWGITASSCPDDKALLRELEKSASAAEPDRSGRIAVEEVLYHPDYGFLKMCVIPCQAGEDKRQNKKVCFYQPAEGKAAEPETYLAPGGIWEDEAFQGYLAPAMCEKLTGSPKDIFIKWNLYDRLPDFFRGVFWCLLEKLDTLNIVAPEWGREQFAQNAGELMLGLHRILPQALRKRAGYLSYAEQAQSGEAFYFSSRPCGKYCMVLSPFSVEMLPEPETPLEEYFYYHLAEYYVTEESWYEDFMQQVETYLSGHKTGGNTEKKLEWLFYEFSLRHGGDPLKKRELVPGLPELFYWAAKEPVLKKAADYILQRLHGEGWSQEEMESYFQCLLEGFTGRGQQMVCRELNRMLEEWHRKDRKMFEEKLSIIKQKKMVMARLLAMETEKAGSWQAEYYQKCSGSFSGLMDYAGQVSPDSLSDKQREAMVNAGIRLLNRDIFRKKNYEDLESYLLSIGEREALTEVLAEAVRQLEDKAPSFSMEQLETACYVEKRLEAYEPGQSKGALQAEYKKRTEAWMPDEGGEREEAGQKPGEEQKQEETGLFSDSLLMGCPQGFLTGCVWYLSHYSLTIGHWKIAVGVTGMWLLFMLNYYYMLLHKEKRYPFWKNLGLCLLEGYVIQFIASLFLMQKIRLYYFMALGAAAVGIQIFTIVRTIQKQREQV